MGLSLSVFIRRTVINLLCCVVILDDKSSTLVFLIKALLVDSYCMWGVTCFKDCGVIVKKYVFPNQWARVGVAPIDGKFCVPEMFGPLTDISHGKSNWRRMTDAQNSRRFQRTFRVEKCKISSWTSNWIFGLNRVHELPARFWLVYTQWNWLGYIIAQTCTKHYPFTHADKLVLVCPPPSGGGGWGGGGYAL